MDFYSSTKSLFPGHPFYSTDRHLERSKPVSVQNKKSVDKMVNEEDGLHCSQYYTNQLVCGAGIQERASQHGETRGKWATMEDSGFRILDASSCGQHQLLSEVFDSEVRVYILVP